MSKPQLSEIDKTITESIDSQLQNYRQVLAEYEPIGLFENLFEVLRSIEEWTNIPMELDNFGDFMYLQFDLSEEKDRIALNDIREEVKDKFSQEISDRFSNLFTMCTAIQEGSIKTGANIETISDAVLYFQSRRVCLVATLLLIPHICKGQKKIPLTETLNLVLPLFESCLANIPASYFNLMKSEAIPDFTLSNNDYDHLEHLFIGPIWMSLFDRGEFSEMDYKDVEYKKTPAGKAHSYGEVENTLLQFVTAYEKYAVSSSEIYQQIQSVVKELRQYCADDYTIIVPVAEFEIITKGLIHDFLVLADKDYSNVINSSAAFVIINGKARSSVTLMMAFVSQLLAKVLSRNKKFQLDSGAIFEKKISDILAENEFSLTDIKRINQKEFDLTTTKNNIIYNFHCKNNLIDVVLLDNNYKKMGRLNTLRIKRYEKDLSTNHFVISRFPVLTSVPGIVNFASLDEFLKSM
jgi:hypothetical protein